MTGYNIRLLTVLFHLFYFIFFLQTPRNNSKTTRHLKFSTRRIVEGAKFTQYTSFLYAHPAQ